MPAPAAPLPPDIGAHRLLGDGAGLALLQPNGEIDWWCASAADDDPLLWSLLDPDGARAAYIGTSPADAAGPVAGPVLDSVLRAGATRLRCRDAMLRRDGELVLVRLVRLLDARDSPLDLVHELGLGGFESPRAHWDSSGDGDGDPHTVLPVGSVRVRTSGTASCAGQLVRVRLRVADGWTGLSVSLRRSAAATAGGDRAGSSAESSAGLDAGFDAEATARTLDDVAARAERAVTAVATPRNVYGHRLDDALRVLHVLTRDDTGAPVAAATTSLPEAPGGDRQFDYRYTWLRDASLAVSVASLVGDPHVAERFLGFAEQICAFTGSPLDAPPAVTADGQDVPPEREVSGVAGWAGSRPVRVGNAAAKQLQRDSAAQFVEAVSVHVRSGARLGRQTWRLVRRIADGCAAEVLAGDPPPTAGLWEFREPRRLVSEDLARWLVLDRAVRLARGWRPWTGTARWRRARRTVADRVLAAVRPDGTLPQAYDDPPGTVDASSLLLVVLGLLPREDPRAGALVDAVLARLGTGPFLHRWPPPYADPAARGAAESDPADDEPNDRPGRVGGDTFAGAEGAFLPASFWAVSALANVGRLEEADGRMLEMCYLLPRLLPEMVEPGTARGLGNVPLLWAHAELVRTLYFLDAEHRRRRYGTAGLTLWRAARLARLAARRRLPRRR